MAKGVPHPNRCNKAIKLLEQYKRLAEKHGVVLPAKRMQKLDALRDNGKIKVSDLPPKLRHDFPGEFAGMTLDEIKKECNK